MTTASLAVAGLVLASTVTDSAPAQAADGPAWSCSSYGYLFQSPNLNDPPHSIYQVDLVSGDWQEIGQTADQVNAVGYNVTDDYMYGWSTTNSVPVQIAADGTLTPLPVPAGVNASLFYDTGDVDDEGHYWIVPGNGGPWYEIDYAAGSATFGQVLNSGTLTNAQVGGYDWVYANGGLYSLNASGLHRFDTETFQTVTLGVPSGATIPDGLNGAGYVDAQGYLYFSNNNTGNIYRIDPATNTAIEVSTGPVSSRNDGARCATASVPTITVTKTVASRATTADQFTVGLNNAAGDELTSATTAGAETSAVTTNWPVSVGATYTITDEMAAGSANSLDIYDASIVCTNTTTGQTVTTGGTKGAWTLTVPTDDQYTCNVTNAAPTPSFTVQKAVDTQVVNPGEAVAYTVTVTNTGDTDYTLDNPATFTDDLSAVLDDATYNDDASNGATVAGTTLSWSGALAAGESTTITYSVTVNDPGAGDKTLTNAVVPGDGGTCVTGECVTETLVQSFTVSKEVSAETALPGDVVTYTVTVINTGAAAYPAEEPASFEDDLTNVLDDATYNDDVTGGATVTGATLSWAGALAVGQTIEITYSVTVNDAGTGTGDLNLGNTVVPTAPGGDCDPQAECATDTPIGQFQVSKTSSGAGEVNEGDVVTYTITVTNNSAVDFTEIDPASFTDDLSAVLDDATYNDDATNGATIDGTTLSWEGPLAAGNSIEITYSVTVNAAGAGDGVLTNAVVPGTGGTCIGECSTDDALQAYTVSKTSSAGGSVTVGDVVTYTVTVTNTGAVDYTDEEPASFTDDLSAVLDDAEFNDDASGGATYAAPVLSWSGALPTGASVEVTYSVTVLAVGSGDGELTNAVVPTGPGGGCDPEGECSTTDALRSFTVEKTASATTIGRGQVLTYTIEVTNTGAAAFTADAPATVTDDLTGVLDDASYNGDATNGATYEAPVLSWSLAIPVGESVTLTYSVTVDDELTGDLELVNAVTPGDGGECLDADACVTNTPVMGYAVAKTVDTTTTGLGKVVTYTITIENTGAADYTETTPASFTDNLSEVLDDATYNNDATNGATYEAPVLRWSGPLAVGEVTTVTYSVTVNDSVTGDRELLNAVTPGDGQPCFDACQTRTVVEVPGLPSLATTGLNPWIAGGGIGVATLAIFAGLVLLVARRRQNITE